VRASDKLRELIDEAAGYAPVASIDQVIDAAQHIDRSVNGILLQLGILVINEDAAAPERSVSVSIKKTGDTCNLYEISVPAKEAGRESFITTYQVHSNERLPNEDDKAATARIITTIKNNIYKMLSDYKKAKQENRVDDARNIYNTFMLDEKTAVYQWQQANTKDIPYTRKQLHTAHGFITSSTRTREKYLHEIGLLSRGDIARKLQISSPATLLGFTVAKIQSLTEGNSEWAELGTITNLTADDLNKQLPGAEIDQELVSRIIESHEIDTGILSLDAVEAITAAALAISAGVRAANKKVEAKYAVR
jgi:hypothetical protein